ncbi:MAG: hypothetical protein KA170_03720 [Candidatus Promineofilum sp.]|nr:hypothetical protein [Promineifilum sp.]
MTAQPKTAPEVETARAAKARADEAIRDCYAAGRTPGTLARSCYAAGREFLSFAEQDDRDARGAYSAQDRQRGAANLPRNAEAARVEFNETIRHI